MKKVLIFSRDASNSGGVVNFIELLKRNLPTGIEHCHFVIGRRQGFWGNVVSPIVPLLDTMRLFFLIHQKRFDTYHVNPSLDVKSVLRDGLFMLFLRFTKAKNVIVAFHGWDVATEKRIRSSILLNAYFRFTFKGAKKYLILAESYKSLLIEIGVSKKDIYLYTTMFDGEMFEGIIKKRDSNELRVVFLSRLVKEKGIYELLESVQKLKKKYRNLKLVIAGSGAEEERIRLWVRNHGIENIVDMVGYICGKEKVNTLINSDIFVLPSYTEGCPVSLLEAMAAGLPVVTTPVGGIPRIVKDNLNGFLLDNVNPKAITAALSKLLVNKYLRHKIGSRNRREAWEKYNTSIVTRLFITLYQGKAPDEYL